MQQRVFNGLSTLFHAGFILLPLIFCAVACRPIPKTETPAGTTELLHSSQPRPDMVGVDAYIVRVPYGQRELLRKLWTEVDEQMIPPVLRRELMDQGLRVGIQGVSMSPTLSTLLNLTATPSPGNDWEVSVADLPKEPLVNRQYRYLMPGVQAMLHPYADTVPEMPLFWSDGGGLCGKTFKDAQGLVNVTAQPLPGGQVRFSVTPELVYGTPETSFRMQGGVVFPETAKPKHTFHSLAIALDLLPGQWIVIGPVSATCSGVGRCFFTREVGNTEQKVILLRLARIHHDPIFDRTPLPEAPSLADSPILERN